MTQFGYVYGILDSSNSVRYVGKTNATPAKRFAGHVRTAARGHENVKRLPVYRWLAKHLDEAHVVEIESGLWTRTELNTREIEWIAYFDLATLLNVARGGDTGWEVALRKRVDNPIVDGQRGRHVSAVCRGECPAGSFVAGSPCDICRECTSISTFQRWGILGRHATLYGVQTTE